MGPMFTLGASVSVLRGSVFSPGASVSMLVLMCMQGPNVHPGYIGQRACVHAGAQCSARVHQSVCLCACRDAGSMD